MADAPDPHNFSEKMRAALRPPRPEAEEHDQFKFVRARTRGALIAAHHDLSPNSWTEGDDRILDLVGAWLDSLRGR